MARPGLRSHPKFKRLMALLRIPEAHLYGHLQMLWDAAYEFGEDIGDDVDVEINAGWTGEPGALCKAMAECAGVGREGFIEPNPDRPGHWRVHDLYDHAPKYVQKRMEREAERLKRGQTITDIRRLAAKEMHKQKQTKQTDANGNHLQTDADKTKQTDANGRTPSPSPSPSTSLRSAICTEADEPPAVPPPLLPPEPVLVNLPCVGKGLREWPVTQRQVDQWAEAFPGVSILAEVRKMRLWLEDPSHAPRRKTYKGTGAFVLTWLGRAQNQAPANGRASPLVTGTSRTPTADEALTAQIKTMQFPTLASIAGGRP